MALLLLPLTSVLWEGPGMDPPKIARANLNGFLIIDKIHTKLGIDYFPK